jgi:hypothetical protein
MRYLDIGTLALLIGQAIERWGKSCSPVSCSMHLPV